MRVTPVPMHDWNLSPAEARAVQERLRARVETRDRLGSVRRIAGVDVGFEQDGRVARAAVAVLGWPGLDPIAASIARVPCRFPYVPGLLSFRELPAVLAAIERLDALPDLILADAQGVAHPRRFGLACHLGVLLDVPVIGAAKSRLTGTHDEPGPERGEWTPLREGSEIIGAVLRTRWRTRPLYVSIGHRVTLATAIHWALACAPRFRLPETTRRAHRLASG